MPDVLIQKYFYPAVAEWQEVSVDEIKEMAEQYSEAQVLNILAKNYASYAEFIDQDGFIDDFLWAMEDYGFVEDWTAGDYKEYVEENNLSFLDVVKYYQTLITNPETKEAVQESITNKVDPVEPPAPIAADGTLAKLYAMEELPEEYTVKTDAVFNAGAVTVEEAGEAYTKVEGILAGADNADELSIDDLFAWDIADTAANILESAEETVVTGATEVSLAAEETATVAQAEELLDLENFDGVYSIADSAANILDGGDTVEGAVAVALAEDEKATVAQADELLELENFDNVYNLKDTAANLTDEDAASTVDGAEAYWLSDAEGHITAADADAKVILEAAENAGDYTFGILGNTVELTTDTDIVGPEVEDEDFQTTDDDDTIIGVSSSLSSERTLNPGDQIDGGEGTDTLEVTLKSNFTGFSGDGFMKNVEIVDVTNDTTVTRSFAAKEIEGAEKYVLNAEKAAIKLTDLAEAGITVDLNGQKSGDAEFVFTADAIKGTADTLNVNLTNVGTDETKADAGDQKYVNIKAAGIEELNVSAATDNNSFVNLAGATAAKVVNAAGAGDLDISAVAGTVTKFDANEATGDVTANLADAGILTEVFGGSGDDTITVDASAATLSGVAEVSGGLGDDKLILTGERGSTLLLNQSGFQTLGFKDLTGDITAAFTNTSDVENVELGDLDGKNARIVDSGVIDLNVMSTGANDGTFRSDHSGTTTLDLTATAAKIADEEYNDISTAFTLTGTSELNMDIGTYANYTGTVTAAQAGSFSLDIAGAGKVTAATLSTAEAASGNITTGTAASELTLTAENLENLDVTANGDYTQTFSNADNLQVLTVDTDGHFTNSGDLTAVSNVTLTGSDSDSQVTLGAIGASDLDYDVNISASGLAEGFVTDTIKSDQGVSVDASAVTGTVELGAITSTNSDVTLDFGGAGAITLAEISGTNVTVNASGAVDGVHYGQNITAKDSVTINGPTAADTELDGTNGQINIAAGSTGFEASLNGSVDDDSFKIEADSGTTALETIVVTGDLRAGDDDSLEIVSTESTKDQTITTTGLAGVRTVEITTGDGDDTITTGGSVDKVYALLGGDNTINTGAGDDFIAVYGGSNTLTGGAGDDTFVIGKSAYGVWSADDHLDTITDFVADSKIFAGDSAGATSALGQAASGQYGIDEDKSVAANFASNATFVTGMISWSKDWGVEVDASGVANFWYLESGSQTFSATRAATGAAGTGNNFSYAFSYTEKDPDSLTAALNLLDNNLGTVNNDVVFGNDDKFYLFIGDGASNNMFVSSVTTGTDQVVELQGISGGDEDDYAAIVFA